MLKLSKFSTDFQPHIYVQTSWLQPKTDTPTALGKGARACQACRRLTASDCQWMPLPTCGDNGELSYLSNVELLGSRLSYSFRPVHAYGPSRDSVPESQPEFEWAGALSDCVTAVGANKGIQIFYAKAEINFCQSIVKNDDIGNDKSSLMRPHPAKRKRFKYWLNGQQPKTTKNVPKRETATPR